MENIKYYVLGIEGNEMLKKYREDYYVLLKEKINKIEINEIKEKLTQLKEYKDFILNSDNSSRIEYFYNYSIKGHDKFYDHENIIKLFLKDIDYYLEYKKINNSGSEKISGTNIYLTDFDRNPYNEVSSHPTHYKGENIIGWGSKSKDEWFNIYIDTFKVLEDIDKGLYSEINFLIQKIIPFGVSEETHNSTNSEDAIGYLYLGLFIDNTKGFNPILPVLEALIHEFSHTKINLIEKFDPIILNDRKLSYYSPYRPDARHLWGIFYGIHAFVPTIYTIIRYYKVNNLQDENLLRKLITYNAKNNLSLKILSGYADFTSIGSDIMEEIKYVMSITNKELKDISISKYIRESVKIDLKDHYDQVKGKYSYIKP